MGISWDSVFPAANCSGIHADGIEITIETPLYGGGATATLETEAWFGCNQWEDHEES